MDKLTGFVDKKGKAWDMSQYASLLGPEATIQSYRQGNLNGMVESGATLGRISEGGSANTCSVCQKWAGQVVSLTGDVPGIPSIDEAIEEGLFHPNCVHMVNVISSDAELDYLLSLNQESLDYLMQNQVGIIPRAHFVKEHKEKTLEKTYNEINESE